VQASQHTHRSVDVAIVGAGVIGLATAWQLRRRGVTVCIIDPEPAHAATHAAAGMLAPVSEATYGETAQVQLATESVRRYGSFVADLESATGMQVGLRREGTLIVGADAGDREMLADLHAFQTGLGLESTMLTGSECRVLEPMLHPQVRCGLLVTTDLSVDNRRLAAALLHALDADGDVLVRQRVDGLTVEADEATGVVLDDGTAISAGTVVVAAGPWTALVPGIPPTAQIQVRPVKGEIIRLRATPTVSLPARSIRGLVNGQSIYLVPRADGELVVGATVEEAGFDTTVRAGAVRALLRDARAVLPAVDELELVETIAALRPGSPDNLPIIGTSALPRLVYACGHSRNGILLAPITADLLCALLTGTMTDQDRELLELVSPARFAPAEVSA
jgi:glycine oxidase